MNKIKVHVGVVADLFKTEQKQERQDIEGMIDSTTTNGPGVSATHFEAF